MNLSIAISKSTHNRYRTYYLYNSTYIKYANAYTACKLSILISKFFSYLYKYDLEIKLQLIEGFSQVELKKRFSVKKCLNQFYVSNKDLAKIKKKLIGSFFELKDSELIENEFSLTFKNSYLNKTKKIEDLSPKLLYKIEFFLF